MFVGCLFLYLFAFVVFVVVVIVVVAATAAAAAVVFFFKHPSGDTIWKRHGDLYKTRVSRKMSFCPFKII